MVLVLFTDDKSRCLWIGQLGVFWGSWGSLVFFWCLNDVFWVWLSKHRETFIKKEV